MAASFGRHLIFDHDAGKPSIGIALHGAFHIERVTKTRVTVPNHRYGYGVTDVAPLIHHLVVGNQPCIGHCQACAGDTKAAHKHDFEAGCPHEFGRHGVVATGHDKQSWPFQ